MQGLSKSRVVFFILSVALVVPILSTTLFGAPPDDEESGDSIYKYLSVFTEVLRLVRQVYVDEPDIRSLMMGALDGASDALDAFSVYVPPEEAVAYRESRSVGESRSGVLVLKERGVAYVAAVQEGSPGAAAGLERGDILAKLDGRSSRAMPMWEIRKILAGSPGSRVVMEVVRRGSNQELTLELASFEPRQPELEERRGVTVVRLFGISEATDQALDALLGARLGGKLLFDLRGLAGGESTAAYGIAGRFVRGELGTLVKDDEVLRRFRGEGNAAWEGDLGVLIDRASQGAAEILASTLRQGAGAKLIGEDSFGHAGESSLVQLASGALLDITSGFYTGPDGVSLNTGLEPDLEVVHFGAPREGAPEGEDVVLERAIEIFLEAVGPVEEAA